MNQKILELTQKFKELKHKSESATEVLKEINLEWTDVENQLIEAMGEEGVKSIKIEGLGLFSLTAKSYLSVNAANKPKFYEYLQESGNEALLKLDVNPRTLTAFLKGHLDALINERLGTGQDEIDARNNALQFLNEKGASYFVDRLISFREDK